MVVLGRSSDADELEQRLQRERKRHETWNRENFEQHEFDQTIFNNREY